MVVWVMEDNYIVEDLHSQVRTLWNTHQAEINVFQTTLFLVLLQHVYYFTPRLFPTWVDWKDETCVVAWKWVLTHFQQVTL